MAASRTIFVAGAGIGGLTASLTMAARGFRVVVLEKAERLEESGAGLQLSPNASRVLMGLGLKERLYRAVTPEAISIMSAIFCGTIGLEENCRARKISVPKVPMTPAATRARARELAALPQRCLREDRASSYAQWGLGIDDALRVEYEHGMRVVMGAGQQAFDVLCGRHDTRGHGRNGVHAITRLLR